MVDLIVKICPQRLAERAKGERDVSGKCYGISFAKNIILFRSTSLDSNDSLLFPTLTHVLGLFLFSSIGRLEWFFVNQHHYSTRGQKVWPTSLVHLVRWLAGEGFCNFFPDPFLRWDTCRANTQRRRQFIEKHISKHINRHSS